MERKTMTNAEDPVTEVKTARATMRCSPLTSRNEKMLFKVEQNKPCGGQEVWLDF